MPVDHALHGTSGRHPHTTFQGLTRSSVAAPLYILGYVGWPVRWSVTPSYIQGLLVGLFIAQPRLLTSGFVSWPVCRSLRPHTSQGSLIGPFVGQSRPPSSRVRWLGRSLLSLALLHQGFVDWPVCWSVMPSYILGFVDWPVCWSVTPSYIQGSLVGPFVAQPRPLTSGVR